MRLNQKQADAHSINDLQGVSFHKFMELEGSSNSIEIAEELGVSLQEVKKLKKKINRS